MLLNGFAGTKECCSQMYRISLFCHLHKTSVLFLNKRVIVLSNVLDNPVLPEQETAAQLDVAGNSLPEQKSVVSQSIR